MHITLNTQRNITKIKQMDLVREFHNSFSLMMKADARLDRGARALWSTPAALRQNKSPRNREESALIRPRRKSVAESQFACLYYDLKLSMYFFCEEKVHTFECIAKEYARSGTYFDDVMQRERERGCLVTRTATVHNTFYISFIPYCLWFILICPI